MKTQYIKNSFGRLIIYLTIVLTVFNFNELRAQSNHDTEELVYNVGIGMALSTFGAIINKKPGEKTFDVIKKSLWQGALGGYITYESKRIVRLAQENEQWEYYWIGKVVNATGTSIKENASRNLDFYETFHVNFGFNRIEVYPKERFKIKYKILPVALILNIRGALKYNFDFENTFKTGEFIYFMNDIDSITAQTSAGLIVYDKGEFNHISNKDKYRVFTHEIIHIYQSNDFSVLNTYLDKPLIMLNDENTFINWLNNNVEFEFHYLPLRAMYIYETKTADSYYDNFFEVDNI